MVASELDEIDGIGKVKKKEILKHFTSIEKLRNASIEDLQTIKSLNKKDCVAIYNKFHN